MPRRGEEDGLYPFKLELSADDYAGKELAMNAVASAKVWHRRLGHLNKHSLEPINRQNGNGFAFDDSMADCDVCAVGYQLVYPKKAKHATINEPFQLVYGDLMDPFKPTARGGYEFVSEIIEQFTK